jgi:polar amino acid transport system substrate-binding protein
MTMLKFFEFNSRKAAPSLLQVAFFCMLLFFQSGCTTPPSGVEKENNSSSPAASPVSLAADTLHYAVFPAPPYMIGAEDEPKSMSGIDVEIAQEIARRLNLKIEFIKCTWARCLELMKSGEADLLSSAYKKPDREAYMIYFDKAYLEQLPIAFYYLKNKNVVVRNYEDIYQFNNIGVLHDASYFDRFDKDTRAKKFEVPSQEQLFPMLLAGRIDAMAGYVPTENYRLNTGGYRSQIERSTYEYQEQALVYMTISKMSPFAKRIKELNQINDQLLADGSINRIINVYYEKYR